MSGELILYTAEDGRAVIQLRAEGGTVAVVKECLTTATDGKNYKTKA